MKRLSENQKVTLTLEQLKKLVREAIESGVDGYSGSGNLRAQLAADLKNIIKHGKELGRAAKDLLEVKYTVDTRLKGSVQRKAYDVLKHVGFYDIMVDEDGDEVGRVGFGYEHMCEANGPFIVQVTDDIQVSFRPRRGVFNFSLYDDYSKYSWNDFIDLIMSGKISYFTDDDPGQTHDIGPEEVRKIADAIHEMSESIPSILDKVDGIYEAYIHLDGIKV